MLFREYNRFFILFILIVNISLSFSCFHVILAEQNLLSEPHSLADNSTVREFDILFNSDGGSFVKGQKVVYGDLCVRPSDPYKEGYSFDGWYKGSTLYDFSSAVTDSFVLKAKWKRDILVTEIRVPSTQMLVNKGQYINLEPVCYPENARNRNVFYQSLKSSIASVDSSGRVKGVASGSTTIKISSPDANTSSYVRIDVVDIPTSTSGGKIQIIPESQYFTTNNTVAFHAFDTAGKKTSNVIWNVIDGDIAEIDSNGVVSGKTAGITSVSAILDDANSRNIIKNYETSETEYNNTVAENQRLKKIYDDASADKANKQDAYNTAINERTAALNELNSAQTTLNDAQNTLNNDLQNLEAARVKAASVQSIIDETERKRALGSLGFFDWHGSSTYAEDFMRSELDKQSRGLGGNDESIPDEEKTHMGLVNDATNIDNMWNVLPYLRECNNIRRQHGLSDLYVTDFLMAAQQLRTNAAAYLIDHSHWYGEKYYFGENLTYDFVYPADPHHPFEAWYDTEKAVYDYCVEHGYTTNQHEFTSEMINEIAEALEIYPGYVQTGHYLNIVKPEYEIMGFGVNTEWRTDNHYLTWGQGFGYYNAAYGEKYTVDQYEADFMTYYNSIYTQEYKDAKAAVDNYNALTAKVEEDRQSVSDAQAIYNRKLQLYNDAKNKADQAKQERDQAVANYNSAKSAYDASVTELNTKKETYESYKAQYNNIHVAYTITVITAVEGVALQTKPTYVYSDRTYKATCKIIPANSTNTDVTWTSSDPLVASIDGSGSITVHSTGKATITVRTEDGGFTDSYELNATDRTVIETKSFKLNKNELTLMKGELETLLPIFEPWNATSKSLTWTSSDDSIVYVNSQGKISARAVGTATIEARTKDGAFYDSCTVTVTELIKKVTSIRINYSSYSLGVNRSAVLKATVYPSDATNKTLEWTSSDPSVVVVDNNGNIKGIKKGTATIKVSSTDGSNVSAVCNVTVTQPVTSIVLDKTRVELNVGDVLTLNATVYPADATDKKLVWTTSDANVVTVTESGKLTAVGDGAATITVASNANRNTKATCTVIVNEQTISVTSIILDKTNASLEAGDSLLLNATVYPTNAYDRSLIWSSSNSAIVSVNNNGELTALKAGTATITATSSSNPEVKAQCIVTVKEAAILVTSVELDKTSATLAVGETLTLKATVYPANATNKSVSWLSSNNEIATVDNNGIVTAKKIGSVIILAHSNESMGIRGQCKITVTEEKVSVTAISLDKTTALMETGESLTLKATIYPSNATDKTLSWSSSNPSVVSVDNNGKLSALKAGTSTITVTSTDGSDVKAQCKVTVIEKTIFITNISLDKTTVTLKTGDTLSLIAVISPSNATNKTISWATSNGEVVSIDGKGNLTALKTGTAIITARSTDGSGVSAKCNVTVTDNKISVTAISLNKTTLVINKTETISLTATIYPSNATDKTLSWSSSNPSVVSVDNNGKLSALKAGTSTITVTSTDGSDVKAQCKVTVTDKKISVTSIFLDKSELSLSKGDTLLLKASVNPDNATDKSLNWRTSDAGVVVVDNSGKLTAISEGEATITVSSVSDPSVKAYCKVTVTQKQIDPLVSFITRLYNLCLERDPDESGLSYYRDQLTNKTMSAADCVKGFFDSPEMKSLNLSDEEFIRRCYRVMMDREADEGGLSYWLDFLNNGVSRTFILKGFVDSREFIGICSDYGVNKGTINLSEPRDLNPGVTSFVARCYTKALGRQYEVDGLNYHCNRILSAKNKKAMALEVASNGFFHSPEFLNKHLSDEDYIRVLYATFLGREAEPDGLSYYSERIAKGEDRDVFLNNFAASPEFTSIMKSYGIE